ncbi:MAG: DUF5320 domain-containing protein [Tissierellia bacterium]|nr:DUF5320 domain-containing protein [Tissierellia bacterium]
MPGRNGTGPLTGRGMGPCGRGCFSYRPRSGFRYGYGRGLGNYAYYEPNLVDENAERAFIEEEKATLEARLKDINEILDELQDQDE